MPPPQLAGGAGGVGVAIAAGDGDAATGDSAGTVGGEVAGPVLHATSNTVTATQIGIER